MELVKRRIMYEVTIEDLPKSEVETLGQFPDHLVKAINAFVGSDTDVQLNIERDHSGERAYKVMLDVFGLGEQVQICKSGKSLVAALRKVKRKALKRLNQLSQRDIYENKNPILKAQVA